MMERNNNLYCYQRYSNPLVREIRLMYGNNPNGSGDYCEIAFCDGTTIVHKIDIDTVYTRQYGVPLSADGTMMYVCDWFKGLTAYDTRSGNEMWRIKRPHIRMTQIFSDYGVTTQYGKGLIQFDLKTGEIRNTIENRQIENMYYLKGELVLVDKFKGSVCVVDCRTMSALKLVPPSVLNPHECLSLVLHNAYVKENNVIIVGCEQYSRTNSKYKKEQQFERVVLKLDRTENASL